MDKFRMIFNYLDKVWHSVGDYYAESKIIKIVIDEEGIKYYTDTPRCFTNEDIGISIFSTYENAKRKYEIII